MATAHHKRSDCGSGLGRPSYAPHAGPVVGDASYRLHFPDPESYRTAMALAAQLEAMGLSRRAWRVRWNLDGPQPAPIPLPPTTMETDDDRGGRNAAQLADVPGLVEATGLSNWQIGRALNVSAHAVKNWRHGGRITPQNYAKLKEFCK